MTCLSHDFAGWWFKPEFIINQLNINGAIGYPWHKDTVPISQNTLKLSGYAYSGGGRRVYSFPTLSQQLV